MFRPLRLFIVALLVFAAYQYGSDLLDAVHTYTAGPAWEKRPTPFDDEKIIQKQLVYAGNDILVLYNHAPLFQGHILIIPKRSVERLEELSDGEWQEIKTIIQKMHLVFQKAYGANDYVLFLQNGFNAGQTVPHFHFHMIPRDDTSIVLTKFHLWSTALLRMTGIKKPLSQEQIKQEIHHLQSSM